LKLLYPDEATTRKPFGVVWSTRWKPVAGQRAVEEDRGMEFFDVHFSYIDVETLERGSSRAGARWRFADPDGRSIGRHAHGVHGGQVRTSDCTAGTQ